jgi:hypothetical protein
MNLRVVMDKMAKVGVRGEEQIKNMDEGFLLK